MTDERTQTMKDVSHTNPNTGETAGHLFTRGPVVAADGGREEEETADETEAEAETDRDEQTMKDISHTPPHDASNANRVFERGGREQERDNE